MDIKRKYKAAAEYLDDEYAYFLTHVLKIGKPEVSNIPTACVAAKVASDGSIDPDNFEFLFGSDFADSLNVENFAFVLGHETMHIILNHLRLQKNFVDFKSVEKIQEKQKRGERLTKDEMVKMFKLKREADLFNIAADCVINDYLIECGLEPSGELEKMACRGEKWIGENAAFMTVTEVYERIDQQSKDDADENGTPIFVMGDGSEGSYSEMDSHDWMLNPKAAEALADAIDKLNDEYEKSKGLPQDLYDKKLEEEGKATANQQALNKSMTPGTQDANMENFVKQHGVQMAWVKLLKDVDPNMFKVPGIAPPMVPSFHRRRRKLSDKAFTKINLPVYRRETRIDKATDEIPSIVLALDVSGSIGPRDADRFVSLAMSIPRERIHVFACTFQTTYQKIDLDNPKFNKGGGTNFDAIAHFINKEVLPELKGKYPKAVVVITDGAADMQRNLWPDEKNRDGWLWLMSPQDWSHYGQAIKNIGTKKMLDEYIA